jgi:hypothetical protein
MSAVEFMPGTPGVMPEDVTQVIVHARGRSEDGMGLSPQTIARVEYAAEFFTDHNLLERGGSIICSGYRTPRDHNGRRWVDETTGIVYQGIPEAINSAYMLEDLGIPRPNISVEPDGYDTPRCFVRTNPLLRPDEVAGIVGQPDHLKRMLTQIAPRVMRVPYVGLVVPEGDVPDPDSWIATLHTGYILRGMTPDNPHLQEIIDKRSERAWRLVLAADAILHFPEKLLAKR